MGKWEMSKYTVEQLNNDYKSGRITVPKYQRGAVWNKKQKEKLIDSMNKGYPFGSILLYQKDGKRQIIDGLQRSTTIIEFVKNPARYFTDDNINDEIVNKIIDSLGVVGPRSEIEEKLISIIKNWVSDNHHTMQDVQRMQYGDLVDEITLFIVLLWTWFAYRVEKERDNYLLIILVGLAVINLIDAYFTSYKLFPLYCMMIEKYKSCNMKDCEEL